MTFDDVTCNADALSELLGVTRETVARFATVDGMPKGGRGVYPVAECVNWCIDRERNKGSNESPADKQARLFRLFFLEKVEALTYVLTGFYSIFSLDGLTTNKPFDIFRP